MKLAFGVLLLLSPGNLRVGSVAHMRRKAPVREKKAYDTGVRAFSPDGSIYQVEYAVQAAEKGGLAIGVQTDEGLVLAAQGRRRSPLLKSASVSKLADVDARMCCAMSGLLPDGRLLLDYARTWVQEHRFEFDEAPTVEAVASQLSRLALKFNGYDKDGRAGGGREGEDGGGGGLAMSRPVGVALLMAGVDRGDRPVLYHLDPSGACVRWRARAIGEKGAAAEAKLEKAGPFESMTVRRAMAVVLGVLKEVLEDEFSTDRLEMVCVDVGDDETGAGGGGEGGVEDHTSDAAGKYSSGSGDSSSSSSSSSSKRGRENSAVGVGPSGGEEEGAITDGSNPLGLPVNDGGSGGSSRSSNTSDNSTHAIRNSGSSEWERADRSVAESGSAPPAATSFVSRRGYFRRVSKSEMEQLLVGDGV